MTDNIASANQTKKNEPVDDNEQIIKVKNNRNAVIALTVGFSTRQLKPFIKSLRKYNEHCEIILFTSNLKKETISFLTDHQVTIRKFNKNNFGAHVNIHNSRHLEILNWLEGELSHQRLPDQVFLTDIRDVIFQGDPFKNKISSIEFFMEHTTPNIGQCPANSSWIQKCFGNNELQKLYEKQISCSGTVFATGEYALKYLRLMKHYIQTFSKDVQKMICDQGIHNFILYNNLLENIKVYDNGIKILTVGYVPHDYIEFKDNLVLYKPTMLNCQVVHQWDRHEIIKNSILKLYDAEPDYIEQLKINIRNKTRKKFTLNYWRKKLRELINE